MFLPEVAMDPGSPESTSVGFRVFLSDRIQARIQKFYENRTRRHY